METLIVICLLVVLVLLVHDKITFKQSKTIHRNKPIEKRNETADDIIGKPKSAMGRHPLTNSKEAQFQTAVGKDNSFGQEINIEGFITKLPQEVLDDDFKVMPNFEEEEEEWRDSGEFYKADGFATGVTFEELNIVGKILHHDLLKNPLQDQAVQVFQKLDGTELLNLLESSIDNASQKIAVLLDSNKGNFVSINRRNDKDFDIQNFINH